MLHSRPDNVVIDARYYRSKMYNPFAVAHRINHPPPGRDYNVVPFAYNFPINNENTADNLRWKPGCMDFIPNINFMPKSAASLILGRGVGIHVHGIVFVATRVIEDEELFVNYRLNPKLQRPEWYNVVEPLEELRHYNLEESDIPGYVEAFSRKSLPTSEVTERRPPPPKKE